jgi:hypothetical protein
MGKITHPQSSLRELFSMTNFLIYPRSFRELFEPDIMAAVLPNNCRRLRRLFLEFKLVDYRFKVLCELFLRGPPIHFELLSDRSIEDSATVSRELALHVLKRSCARFCFWMCDLRLAEGVALLEGAPEVVRANFAVIKGCASECFALRASYDCYRYYATRVKKHMEPDWFERNSFDAGLELLQRLRRSAYNADEIFEDITADFG